MSAAAAAAAEAAERERDRAERARALCRVTAELHARGWCLGTGGNFSVLLEREPLRLLCTQSGLDKGKLDPARDLVTIDGDGVAVDAGLPSAEARVHGAIARRTDAGAILHTHSVDNTLLGMHFVGRGGFTIRGYEMQKGIDGIRSHEDALFVPVVPNTQDMVALARATERLIAEHPAARGFLIAGHGLYAWGRTLDEAKRHVEIFEFLFQVLGRRVQLEPFTG